VKYGYLQNHRAAHVQCGYDPNHKLLSSTYIQFSFSPFFLAMFYQSMEIFCTYFVRLNSFLFVTGTFLPRKILESVVYKISTTNIKKYSRGLFPLIFVFVSVPTLKKSPLIIGNFKFFAVYFRDQKNILVKAIFNLLYIPFIIL